MIKTVSKEYFEESMGGRMFPMSNIFSENDNIFYETYIPLDVGNNYCVFFDCVIRDCHNVDYLKLMKSIDCIMPDVNKIKMKYIEEGLEGFEDNLVYEIE